MHLAARWRYLSLTLLLLACILVGRFAYVERFNTLVRPYEILQNAQLDQKALQINARLSLIENQIRLFNHELKLLDPKPEALHQVMLSMFSVQSDLLQVRWIDQQGIEQVRVNKTGPGVFTVVATEGLQNKSNRYYFKAGQTLSENEVFISQIDLNVERGEIQRPYQPTLRAVMKASLSSFDNGYLVINFDLRSLLSALKNQEDTKEQILIGAGENRWIIHPLKEKEWQPDLAGSNAGIATDLPDILSALRELNIVQGLELNNQLYSAIRLRQTSDTYGSLQAIYIVSRSLPPLLPSLKQQALIFSLTISGIMALAGLIVFRIYALHFIKLRKLSETLATERDNLKQALARQSTLINELAESKKLSSLSVMVAGLAHELNTPLGATQLAISTQKSLYEKLISSQQNGLTRSAFEDYLTGSKQSLQQALQNNQRAIELIQGFKRLTFERATDEMTNFNIAEKLNDLWLSMKGLLRKNNVRLSLDIPPELNLTGYSGAFSQIVQIFITNAIDHAFSGLAGACIEIRCVEKAEQVLVTVEDNGKGIPTELLPLICEPFVTSQRHAEHTGLGLHMAKVWIKQAFDGDILVDSTYGKGTCFTLIFTQQVHLADELNTNAKLAARHSAS